MKTYLWYDDHAPFAIDSTKLQLILPKLSRHSRLSMLVMVVEVVLMVVLQQATF